LYVMLFIKQLQLKLTVERYIGDFSLRHHFSTVQQASS
jgi:hypothetical protein